MPQENIKFQLAKRGKLVKTIKIKLPAPEKFFGTFNKNIPSIQWGKRQLNLFDDGFPQISMSVSKLVTSFICPNLFDSFYIKKDLKRLPIHPIAEIGIALDKFAKRYFTNPSSQENIIEGLDLELQKLHFSRLNLHQISIFKNVLTNFIKSYEGFQFSNSYSPNETLSINFNRIVLKGKIDLLLESKSQKDQLTLIDLKVGKYGNKIENIDFPEILQILIYAYGLIKKGIKIQNIGFYFFMQEVSLILHVSDWDINYFEKLINQFIENMIITNSFQPKKCYLCLICKLKNNCPIGKNINQQDFSNPLLPGRISIIK